MEKKGKTLYIDMDDCIADFYSAARDITGTVQEHRMFDEEFFLRLNPMPGAKGAVFELGRMGYDIWILSQPLAELPESYIHKVQWVQLHFPQLYRKIILTQDKSLNRGEFLIDDNATKWQQKFEQGGGKFIHFCYGGYNGNPREWNNPEDTWREIVEMLSRQNPYK